MESKEITSECFQDLSLEYVGRISNISGQMRYSRLIMKFTSIALQRIFLGLSLEDLFLTKLSSRSILDDPRTQQITLLLEF